MKGYFNSMFYLSWKCKNVYVCISVMKGCMLKKIKGNEFWSTSCTFKCNWKTKIYKSKLFFLNKTRIINTEKSLHPWFISKENEQLLIWISFMILVRIKTQGIQNCAWGHSHLWIHTSSCIRLSKCKHNPIKYMWRV